MAKFDLEEEKWLAIYVRILRENPRLKEKTIAQKHHVSYYKLRRRLRNVPNQRTNGGHNKRLNLI